MKALKRAVSTLGARTVDKRSAFFVDAEGFVVDRLRKFEAKAPFLKRLAKLTNKPSRE